MKRVLVGLLVAGSVPGFSSELPRGCFRSVAEAVSQTAAGERVAAAGAGYRLTDVRRDALRNRSWAMVESCGHPEQPTIAVELPGAAGQAGAGQSSAGQGAARSVFTGPAVMIAGSTVRVIRRDANVRLEVPAVAQANGALGERIRVRVVRAGDGFGGMIPEEQILVGVVKSADVLEME